MLCSCQDLGRLRQQLLTATGGPKSLLRAAKRLEIAAVEAVGKLTLVVGLGSRWFTVQSLMFAVGVDDVSAYVTKHRI